MGGLISRLYHEGENMRDKVESSKQKVASKATKVKEKSPEGKAVTSKKKLENSDKTKTTETKTPKKILNTDNAEQTTNEVTAKAGKRSAKAIKETEEKQAKEDRKEQAASSSEHKPKITQKPPRSRIERRSKKYRELERLIDKNTRYSISDSIILAKKTSPTKFDATLELHIRLNVDPKQADQNIRGTAVLPSGTGKTIKVAVFCESDDTEKAKKAGADIAGGEEFLQQLNDQSIDFDLLIATPSVMAKLGKYARLLGPKGLMPNIKSGTVTKDIEKAVKEAKSGRVEYRVDSTGIIHVAAGKLSFTNDMLEKNTKMILSSIQSSKPASIKGSFVENIYITSTMGPSIKLDSAQPLK